MAAALGLARVAWQSGRWPARGADHPAPAGRCGCPARRSSCRPGAFLQATAFGEAELAEAVADLERGCRGPVADLYAGVGTLTLALAGRARRLLACESEPAAVAALRRAAGGRNVTVAERDLVRRPLQPAELDHDLVVLDPPRAGAAAQCAALARSRVPRVIYASCRPESFARDARMLVDAGFALVEVRPIDQFLLQRRDRARGAVRPRHGPRKTPLIAAAPRRYIRPARPPSPSSSGPGRRPLTAKTGVRVP